MEKNHRISVSVGLIQKLAGESKGRKEAQQQTPMSRSRLALGLPFVQGDVAARAAADAQLRQALTGSRKVGQLLLKQEDAEMRKVKALADELVQDESRMRPLANPCESQREACLQCYLANAQDVVRCAPFVEAYSACANQVFQTCAG